MMKVGVHELKVLRKKVAAEGHRKRLGDVTVDCCRLMNVVHGGKSMDPNCY